uniref:Palmitoyltransferase n=1 Tax=Panagrolaimus sp. ES5 TaxID=591445 RepID=A0AC34GQV1_9BILA
MFKIVMLQDTDDGEPESSSSSELQIKAPSLEDVGILEAPSWSVEGAFDPNDIGKSMSQRLCHWGPMLAIFLIVTIGMSATIVFFHIWPPLDSLWGFINLIIFFTWNYMSLTNFLQATRFGGGFVKLGWKPEDPALHKKLQYCPLCEGHKAPRSHHCARCNRCVLKMDHHCPWLNNCVGHRNHALFIKFCFFSIMGCFHAASFLIKNVVVTIYLLYYADKTTRILPQDLPITDIQTMIAALTGATLSLGVCVAVIPLLYIQLWSVYHNMTYIEDYIVSKAEARRHYEKFPFVYPYNLGWRRNVREVLANGTFPKGNGIWWPIRADCSQFTFSEEQIAQKEVKSRHARIRTIAISYNGGKFLDLLRLGCYPFICQPLTDGRRVKVKAGEKWAITRGSKFWVYAKKVEKQSYVDAEGTVQYAFVGTDHLARGWFPRICLEVAKTE